MATVHTNGFKSGSRLERVLRAGHFAVTGELGPPQNADPSVILEKAVLLRDVVDGANVTDNQTAIVRMSSIAAGALALQAGLEPVIQMTARDRNRLAIQSDLLGAYALGARNLLCLTGDHSSFGNHPTAKNVHDIDAIQMIAMVRSLRDECIFQCGDAIKGVEPHFFIGAAAAPFADPIDFRPYRLAKKIQAGADFIQTQLVYDIERFAEYMERVRELGLHEQTYIMVGLGPLKSPGVARRMHESVPGVFVPDSIIQRMTEAGSPWAGKAELTNEEKAERREAWRAEGIQITIELIQQVRQIEGVAGVHIMAIEWEEAVKPIVEGAGLLPRPTIEEETPVK